MALRVVGELGRTEPICRALDLPVPDEPFPHRNTREEFQARAATTRPPNGDLASPG